MFGERRLRACADELDWTDIDVRIVDVSSIAAGEFAENEMRKDFTTSERVAIWETIERKKLGDNWYIRGSHDRATFEKAAKSVGFSNRESARRVGVMVKRGVPELVAAMDRGEIAIEPAATIARLDDQAAAPLTTRTLTAWNLPR